MVHFDLGERHVGFEDEARKPEDDHQREDDDEVDRAGASQVFLELAFDEDRGREAEDPGEKTKPSAFSVLRGNDALVADGVVDERRVDVGAVLLVVGACYLYLV